MKKPKLNLETVRDLVMAAGVARQEARDLLKDEGLDPKVRTFGKLCVSVLEAVEGMLDCGVTPIAGMVGRGTGVQGSGPCAPPSLNRRQA